MAPTEERKEALKKHRHYFDHINSDISSKWVVFCAMMGMSKIWEQLMKNPEKYKKTALSFMGNILSCILIIGCKPPKENEMYNWYYELNLPDLMHLIAEHDIEPDDAAADLFLRRLQHQSVSFAADMIAGATITGRQVTIETTTNRTYKYTY